MSLQAYEIEELIARYISEQSLTEREQEALNAWLRKEENRQLFDELIDKNTWDPHLKDINFYRSRQSEAKKKLDSLLLMSVPFVPVKKLWIKYVAAASVVAVVATGSIYLLTRPKQKVVQQTKPVPAIVQDVPPGGDKATLILDDGSTVVLDDARNGVIGVQGDAKVVKGDGEVKYEGGGKDGEVSYNKLVTPRGGQYRITLPDGSKAWLNAASSIKYPVVFVGDERKVEITGEGYFEIAPSYLTNRKKQPFVVNVNGIQVEVLGTHFNINAYTDEDAVKTTLLEGKVKVVKGSSLKVLVPGQQALVSNRSTSVSVVNDVDIEQTVAWKNGYFQFKDDNLQTVLRQLARWYDLQIVYESQLPNDTYSGKISRQAKISEVFSILETNEIHFKVEGKKLIVK